MYFCIIFAEIISKMGKDVEKCIGSGCNVKEQCYRYKKEDGLYLFRLAPPFTLKGRFFKCEFFWSIKGGVGIIMRKYIDENE